MMEGLISPSFTCLMYTMKTSITPTPWVAVKITPVEPLGSYTQSSVSPPPPSLLLTMLFPSLFTQTRDWLVGRSFVWLAQLQ